jgi:hypothetical protein
VSPPTADRSDVMLTTILIIVLILIAVAVVFRAL